MRLFAPVLALLLAAPAAAAPPPETLALLETGLKRSEARTIGGPAKVVSRAVVSKPGGGDREEVVEETLLAADGTSTSRIVSANRDGKDVTAEKRAEREKKKAKGEAQPAPAAGKAPAQGARPSLGFKVPTGEDRPLFAFDDARAEGDLLVAAYRPVRGARGDDLSTGRLAWRPATGEPAWFEATFASMPTGLKDFLVRFEFAGTGDGTYTRLLRTQGVGGLLWIKRKFDVTVEVTPGPPQR